MLQVMVQTFIALASWMMSDPHSLTYKNSLENYLNSSSHSVQNLKTCEDDT